MPIGITTAAHSIIQYPQNKFSEATTYNITTCRLNIENVMPGL